MLSCFVVGAISQLFCYITIIVSVWFIIYNIEAKYSACVISSELLNFDNKKIKKQQGNLKIKQPVYSKFGVHIKVRMYNYTYSPDLRYLK